jgi:hypothetical protein
MCTNQSVTERRSKIAQLCLVFDEGDDSWRSIALTHKSFGDAVTHDQALPFKGIKTNRFLCRGEKTAL